MKIGVISDTHGDAEAWQKAYKIFAGAKHILHSGDILYHGVFNPIVKTYDAKKLAEMINKSSIPILFAKGNCDSDVDQLALQYPITSQLTEVALDDLTISVHHGDKFSNEEIAVKYKPDIIISGHTHLYGIDTYQETILLNPGSPSLPKDADKTPTVALIENKIVKIVDLNSEKVLKEKRINQSSA